MIKHGTYKDVEYRVKCLDKIVVYLKMDDLYFVQSYYPDVVAGYTLIEYKVFGFVYKRKAITKPIDDELIEELVENSRRVFLHLLNGEFNSTSS